MNTLAWLMGAIAAITLSTPSFADMRVQFVEGAPKDRFVMTNLGDCALGAGQIVIDFTDSRAGLIFDVSGSGAGVEVYQPFEVTQGAQYLVAQPTISDGDQRAVLDISGLDVNGSIAFTIDVDDTIGTRAITVADSEMHGTVYSLRSGGDTQSAVIDTGSQAVIATPDCGA